MSEDIESWEGEGGAAEAADVRPISLSGTPNQVEWAAHIKEQVSREFDRVAQSFRTVAAKQSEANRADTEAILGILEEKRTAVMNREQAGYFIHDWQEISDQVRRMIGQDYRYLAIKNKRRAGSPQPPDGGSERTLSVSEGQIRPDYFER